MLPDAYYDPAEAAAVLDDRVRDGRVLRRIAKELEKVTEGDKARGIDVSSWAEHRPDVLRRVADRIDPQDGDAS